MSCPLHSVVSAPVSTESADCKRHTDLSLLRPPLLAQEPDLLLSIFVRANDADNTSSLSDCGKLRQNVAFLLDILKNFPRFPWLRMSKCTVMAKYEQVKAVRSPGWGKDMTDLWNTYKQRHVSWCELLLRVETAPGDYRSPDEMWRVLIWREKREESQACIFCRGAYLCKSFIWDFPLRLWGGPPDHRRMFSRRWITADLYICIKWIC